jgi:hypothetical protein
VCEKSRPHREFFLSRLFPKTVYRSIFFPPCLPYILYIASQGTIPTLPDNPWEHIINASGVCQTGWMYFSASVRTSLLSVACAKKRRKEKKNNFTSLWF